MRIYFSSSPVINLSRPSPSLRVTLVKEHVMLNTIDTTNADGNEIELGGLQDWLIAQPQEIVPIEEMDTTEMICRH